MTPSDHLVAIDWGTSSLRAVLFDRDGRILDRLSSAQGILFTGGRSFPDLFAELFGPWLARCPGAAALASGMIGSRQGWVEAPYVACPASFADLASGLAPVAAPGGVTLRIVPGCVADGQDRPDVMRGEEMQVFGAIGAGESGIAVLPGTHSKWVAVARGRIAGFSTFMTGEVFGLLRTQSILGRLMPEAGASAPLDPDAFDRGVAAALGDAGAGFLNRLFAVRTLGLLGRMEAAALPDYLSGLMIGQEVRDALAYLPERPGRVVLIGRGDLAERYRRALAAAGVTAETADPDAAFHGLLALAREARLLSSGPA